VFDGHDGHSAASYVKMHLLNSILKDASFSTSAEEAVKNAYLKLDDEFAEAWKQDNSFSSGTTVLSALLQGR
jgi:protein phosphatase 2C family protein 2/3